MERDPYSSPTVHVVDPERRAPSRTRVYIHIGLATFLLLAYAAHFMNYARLTRIWLWSLPAVVLAVTAVLLSLRKHWARAAVYASATLAIGAWAAGSIWSLATTGLRFESWSVQTLAFVPGTVTVLAPMIYCAYVARRYGR